MDKRLVDNTTAFNDDGQKFMEEIGEAIKPIFDKWVKEGYSVSDMYMLINRELAILIYQEGLRSSLYNRYIYEPGDTVTEWCPHCEREVQLEAKWERQPCPNCKVMIVPCTFCKDRHECSVDCYCK